MQRPWQLYRFDFLQDPFKILQRNEASAGSDSQNPGFATFVACGSEHSVRNPGIAITKPINPIKRSTITERETLRRQCQMMA